MDNLHNDDQFTGSLLMCGNCQRKFTNLYGKNTGQSNTSLL